MEALLRRATSNDPNPTPVTIFTELAWLTHTGDDREAMSKRMANALGGACVRAARGEARSGVATRRGAHLSRPPAPPTRAAPAHAHAHPQPSCNRAPPT